MPSQSIPVYQAVDFVGVNGVNAGESISFAAELDLDDTYELRTQARSLRLSVAADGDGNLTLAPETELGTPGAALHLDCCLTMMSGTGQTAELIVLVEVDQSGNVADIYILPLTGLTPKLGYTLVGVESDCARRKFAQVANVSFSRGTCITLASGAQKPIEDLAVGDRVLTRDDGPRPVRWIGQYTVRAVGEFAPVCIKTGALHNTNDLRISPDHRLFIYQRSDIVGAGRHEVMVRARHLVNGETVVRQAGGFVDYFQLLFDTHQIIFAEGIAAETLLVDTRTHAALPDEIKLRLAQSRTDPENRPHPDIEVGEALRNHPDAADLLKRASSG